MHTIARIIFWAVNLLCMAWLIRTIIGWSQMPIPATEAGEAGLAAGIVAGLIMIFFFWGMAALITGLMVRFTQPKGS